MNGLILLKTALIAKEKGFNEPCMNSFDRFGNEIDEFLTTGSINSEWSGNACTRPTQSELHKWLRDNHGLYVIVNIYSTNPIEFCVGIFSEKEDCELERIIDCLYWEEAMEKGLQYALTQI